MPTVTCDNCGKTLHDDEPRGFCSRCLVQEGMAWVEEDFREDEAPEGDPSRGLQEPPLKVPEGMGDGPAEMWRVGDYELLDEVGRGGMGVVYRARQVSLNRIVAVKMILAGHFADPAAKRRFRAEAEAAAALRHPHIVAIHETGEHLGYPYFSMEFVEGKNLAEVGPDKKLSPKEVALCMRKIADAVQCAHEQGILHRDLKPSNVLLDQNSEPRVTDFGLAKRFEKGSDLTLSGQWVGSPDYMAPEQALPERGKVSVRSDVYAMGGIMFRLLVGRPPFQAETVTKVMQQLLETEPEAPRFLNPDIPRDLETVCLKCLEKEPERRYGSARELAEDLERFLQGEPVLARPVKAIEKLWRWCRRKPVLAGLGAAASIMFLAIIIGSPVATLKIMRSRDLVRLNEYSASMGMVQEAIKRGNLGLARSYLESFLPQQGQPDLRGFEWHYYWSQIQPQFEASLPGHSNEVRGVKFSPAGTHLASRGEHGQIKIWEVATGKLVQSRIPNGRLASFDYTPDGNSILMGIIKYAHLGKNGRIDEWNLRTDEVKPLLETASGVFEAAANASVIAVTQPTLDGRIPIFGPVELWDYRSGQKSILPEPGRFVIFSKDGRWLATDGTNGAIRVWDWHKSEVIHHIKPAETDDISPLAFSSDGHYLAFYDPGGSQIRLWDFTRGAVIPELSSGRRSVGKVAFSKVDPDLFVMAGRSLLLWSLSERRLLRELRGHDGLIQHMAFSPKDLLLASAGTKQAEILLWNSNQLSRVNSSWSQSKSMPIRDEGYAPYTWSRWPIVSPDGRWFASSDGTGRIELHDISSQAPPHLLGEGMTPVWFSEDSRILAAVKLGDRVFTNYTMFREFLSVDFWDVKTLQQIHQIDFSEDEDALFEAVVSKQRNYLAAHMLNMKSPPHIRVWRIEDRTNLTEIIEPIKAYTVRTPVAVSSQGLLAYGDRAHSAIRFRDLHTGEERTTPGQAFWTFQFAPDEKTLVGEWQDTIRLWDVTSGDLLAELKESMGNVGRFDISPDGKTLASISGRTMTWWHLPTRRPVGVFDFSQGLFSIHFSPVGDYLALGLGNRIEFFRVSSQ